MNFESFNQAQILQTVEADLWKSANISKLMEHYYKKNFTYENLFRQGLGNKVSYRPNKAFYRNNAISNLVIPFFQNKLELVKNLNFGIDALDKKNYSASKELLKKSLIHLDEYLKSMFFYCSETRLKQEYNIQYPEYFTKEKSMVPSVEYVFNHLYNVKQKIQDLEILIPYQKNIEIFLTALINDNYNSAFKSYSIAENYKKKLINQYDYIDKSKEKTLNSKFLTLSLVLVKKIKRTILDYSTKFTRLTIGEISEKSNVNIDALIITVIKEMVKKKEIYAEYFSSSKSIAFDQQANINEIDNLMKKFEEWDKKRKENKI